ncbi:MAG: Alpha/beta hydrolase family protein [Chloroflexi bacterium ADurb.Bin360]|nr:MAG: Alpha/beta hydrolase family protein [Chloroflexi bacterium ADurb.Bin360]
MGIAIGLGVLLLLILGAGLYFSNIAIYPRTRTLEMTYEWEVEHGTITEEGFLSWPREEICIPSPHGYELHALYIPIPGAKRTAVFAHGITWTLHGSVKYAELFYRRGYNILIYDHRHHGGSGGSNTSFGFYEKDDLKACVDWALERCGADCVVGTHGESMGAATVLQHAAIDPRIAFAVADCPYASAREQFAYRLKVEYHLPEWLLLPVASLITRLRAGWFFAQASPIAVIGQVETPILFIHGAEDSYIPADASVRLFERKPGIKRLYLAPGAEHAQSLLSDPDAYDRELGAFLAEIGLEDTAATAA